MTATWNGAKRTPNKQVHRIAARGAVFQATDDHVAFVAQEEGPVEKPTGEIQVGDSLALIDLPQPTDQMELTEAEAWLLGMLAAEGYVSEEGKVCVTNQDTALLERTEKSWRKVAGGSSSSYVAPSGFEGGHEVTQLRLLGNHDYGRYIRRSLYTRSGHKRIPRRVLNSNHRARLAFLRGFNEGDGLKSTPCTYEFQGFKTASAVMAAGLYWMALTTLHQRAIVCTEEREGRVYYQVNLNSPNVPGKKGQHLRLPLEEVVKAKPIEYDGWLFDLATSTGTFHAGVGQGWVHNSPLRGETFVTRKITRAAARISLGMQDTLYLGNLDAQRDWGHARDFVEGMWLMLQQEEPEDYVLATGETHTVRSFCEKAFAAVGIDVVWRGEGPEEQGFDRASGNVIVAIDPRYFRPTEVDLLLGDARKAQEKLGWQRRYTFDALIKEMAAADLKIAREEQILAANRKD
ncbi:MAG: GDP-mannose 4,6-dehydratase [Rhodothermales bacterium]